LQSRVADLDRQLTPLLVDASTVQANSAKIQNLLTEIKAAAAGIQGDIGVSDVKTSTKINTAIGQVFASADLVLNSLVTAGLLK